MASIRRTLSPVQHDRPPYRNGSSISPLSLGSPTHKLMSNSKPSVSFPSFFDDLRRLAAGAFPLKQFRRSHQSQSWRRSISRWSLFFIIGLLLGLISFRHADDIASPGFSFENKSHATHVNEGQLESKGEIPIGRRHDGQTGMVSLSDSGVNEMVDYKPRDLLIVVTPTYNRALQAYYLNRLGQVLRLVSPSVLWIVVEMNAQSLETAEILMNSGVMFRHLVCTKDMADIKDRGVQQRNTALEHIERHKLDGIVYFADDDNIYSLELFESIREISRFGTWPVGMLSQSKSKAILEGPVCNDRQVIGWHTNEKSKMLRRFHVDMSGFAFNSTILWDPRRWKRPYMNPVRQLDTVKEGFQETSFIEQLVEDESQMEGVPVECNRILNWHLHLDSHGFAYPRGWLMGNNLDTVLPLDR